MASRNMIIQSIHISFDFNVCFAFSENELLELDNECPTATIPLELMFLFYIYSLWMSHKMWERKIAKWKYQSPMSGLYKLLRINMLNITLIPPLRYTLTWKVYTFKVSKYIHLRLVFVMRATSIPICDFISQNRIYT